MREIKFRAWDEVSKKMNIDVSPWRWDFVISNSWHRCEKSNNNGDEAEMLVPAFRFSYLMQFTGIKDKNGNEVYTGDIDESGCVIDFDEIQLCYITIWNQYYKKWCKSKNIATCGLKIIGNIYENQDLLK